MLGFFRNLFARGNRRAPNQTVRLGVELLQTRLNLGGGTWNDVPPEPEPLAHIRYNATERTVTIEGTYDNDHAVIEPIWNSYYSRWYLNVHAWGVRDGTNAVTYDESFRTIHSFVRRVEWRGKEGQDEFVNKSDIESYAEGGPGNDRLTVEGFGKSRLTGDDPGDPHGGSDTLVGGWGVDIIIGGAGNDHLKAGYDNDFVYGGPGVDDIDAARETIQSKAIQKATRSTVAWVRTRCTVDKAMTPSGEARATMTTRLLATTDLTRFTEKPATIG